MTITHFQGLEENGLSDSACCLMLGGLPAAQTTSTGRHESREHLVPRPWRFWEVLEYSEIPSGYVKIAIENGHL